MSWLSDSTELISGGWLSSRYAGHGVLGVDAAGAGLHGNGFFSGVSHPAEDADEFRALLLTLPASMPGVVYNEDGSIEVPPDTPTGSDSGTWRLYKNGVAQLPDPSTFTIIVGNGLSGTATLDGPTVGGAMGVAPPASLSGTATLDGPTIGGSLTGAPPPSASRTYTVYPDPALPGLVGAETITTPTFLKDPEARLDYSWNFGPWLADAGDSVATFTVTMDDGLVHDLEVVAGARITRWISSGPAAGQVLSMRCHIVTQQGRVDDRTIQLQGLER